MHIPEKYMNIMAMFQRALKNEDFKEINAIPLQDLRTAKAYLKKDQNSPYYQLLLDKVEEKELKETHRKISDSLPLIFISYDSRDIDLAYALDRILKRIFSGKIETFIARRDIKAGE